MTRKLCAFLILIIIVAILSGCNNVFKTEKVNLNDKLQEEIEYLDSEIISMLNTLNGISYTNYRVVPSEVKQTNTASNPNTEMNESGTSPSAEQKDSQETSGKSRSDQANQQSNSTKTFKMEEMSSLVLDNNIDWNEIKSNIEIIYTAWITIKLDLQELNTSEEIINKFSDELNQAILAIKGEDKLQSMQRLSNMYAVLPQFIKYTSNDSFKSFVSQTKSETIIAYNYIENSKWERAKNSVELAKETFQSANDIENIEEYKKEDIKRVLALLEELSTSLEFKDKELAFLKYKGLIQELSIL